MFAVMPKQSPKPGPRYQALLEVLRHSEALWNASRVFFTRWDLSPSQFNILNLLGDQPDGITQTDLSRQLIMHRSNVTGLVDRLEKRGLVVRHESPGDRRAWIVMLTPAGRKLLAEILPDYYQAAEAVWGKMPMSQVTQLAGGLERLAGNAQARAAGANDETIRPNDE